MYVQLALSNCLSTLAAFRVKLGYAVAFKEVAGTRLALARQLLGAHRYFT
jgi:hypothetical protein